MPLNKSTTYHQSVQFFLQFFSKQIVFLLSKKIFKKVFFTQLYLKSTQFYHILLSFTSSGTQLYQIPEEPGSVVKLSFFLLSFKLSKKFFFYSVSGVCTQLRK